VLTEYHIHLISNQEKIPPTTIEKDYVLSWVLSGLSVLDSKEHYIFRGGTALKKVYYPDFRYSEDLDFIYSHGLNVESILKDVNTISQFIKDRSNMDIRIKTYEIPISGRLQIQAGFTGPLHRGGDNFIEIDIVDFATPIEVPFQMAIRTPYPDILVENKVVVVHIMDMVTDKLFAISDRPEPRDLYDLYEIIRREKLSLEIIRSQFKQKHAILLNINTLLSPHRISQYRNLWEIRLSHQVRMLPKFEEVIEVVIHFFKQKETET